MKQAQTKMPSLISTETHMELLLWRHAEAVEGTPDLRRRLTVRGEKQARQMADWLGKHAPQKVRILVSPALRCQQTAQALGLPFETDKRLGCDSNVPDLLAATGWPNWGTESAASSAVLVVGHQPTLGRTAALLLSGMESDWSIKKGAVWWFSNRTRQGETQNVLRAVILPDFAR